MSEEKKDRIPTVIKKIGEMTYKVRIHFNDKATETLQEKLERLIREDIKHSKKK